jgi:hypothetical protein
MTGILSAEDMFQMIARIKSIIKLYHYELMGHLEIILLGEFELADKIFDERQTLSRQILTVLKERQKK